MSNNVKEIKEIITRDFEGTEIVFEMSDEGQSFVRIDEVAKFCGWTQTEIKNGKEYNSIKMARVNKFLEELGFDHKCTKGDFIPEYLMYALIGKAKNERATKFMIWVGQVLTEIRQHGAYISDNADSVDKDYIKFARGTIENTLMETPIENLLSLYDECMKFYSKKENKLSYYSDKTINRTDRKYRSDKKLSTNESKLEMSNTIKKVLTKRDSKLISNSAIGCSRDIQSIINKISENINNINKTIARGKLAGKTRENNKLQDKLCEVLPTSR